MEPTIRPYVLEDMVDMEHLFHEVVDSRAAVAAGGGACDTGRHANNGAECRRRDGLRFCAAAAVRTRWAAAAGP
jgi:hypothetical protein